eukprot:scaffold53_cov193-Pinguiococcus_pyrenoidosus.AAC.66
MVTVCGSDPAASFGGSSRELARLTGRSASPAPTPFASLLSSAGASSAACCGQPEAGSSPSSGPLPAS